MGRHPLRHLVSACVLGLAAGTASAVSTFLFIPGVPGESVDDRHRDWIDLHSVSVGVADRACTGFTVTKNLDKSSPLLSGAAMTGGVYPTMTVEVLSDGIDRYAFLTYTLTNVVVGSVQATTTATVPVVESVGLVPAAITMSYRPRKPDGSLDAAVNFTLTCTKKH
jgi:type VI secretion system secreted protein Hcp